MDTEAKLLIHFHRLTYNSCSPKTGSSMDVEFVRSLPKRKKVGQFNVRICVTKVSGVVEMVTVVYEILR